MLKLILLCILLVSTTPQYLSTEPVTCQDLNGVGSLNTTCTLNSNLRFDSDINVSGTGNPNILVRVSVDCPIRGCTITFNVSGIIHVGQSARIVAGSVVLAAVNLTMDGNSSLYTTALGGA